MARYPNFELVGGRALKVVLPAASPPVIGGIPVSVEVSRADAGEPLPLVHVQMLYPNKTWREAHTDSFGRARFALHARLPMTVLCAADGFKACVERNHVPEARLEIRM